MKRKNSGFYALGAARKRGCTECYARLLTQETGLPVYSLAEAKKRVFAGAEVIYLGWIMAGSVKGYAEAAKRYQVRAVCGVGMGQAGTQTNSVRKKSAISVVRSDGGGAVPHAGH